MHRRDIIDPRRVYTEKERRGLKMKLLWGLIQANINIPDKIKEKLTSGRYFQTVCLTSTYCLCMVAFCIMAIKKIIAIETLLAIWAGFTPMVILINEWYFKREDRVKENGQPK